MTLAQILALLLPPLVEKAEELYKRGLDGTLTAEEVQAEAQKLRDAIAQAKADDAAIDGRIDRVT